MAGISTEAIGDNSINGSVQAQAMGEVSSEVTGLVSLMATYHVG